MQFGRRVPQIVHDEHMATMAALEKLETLLLRRPIKSPPQRADSDVASLLSTLIATIHGEITTHFRFETDELFPLLAARGEADIGGLLDEEHETMLPIGTRMAQLARSGRADGFTAASWAEFHQLGGELVERLVSHIQKEEMALLPLLDDLLDDEDDARLAESYAMKR